MCRRARTLHVGDPAPRADVGLHLPQRPHPRHRHRFELRRAGTLWRLRRTGGQAGPGRGFTEVLPPRRETRGQSPFVRSTFRAVPANGDCPRFSRCRVRLRRSRAGTGAKIAFWQHDLLSLVPVREGLSLIVCKNVLLHFDESQRIEVLRMFHRALQPGGTLVMEHTQKLPDALAPFSSRSLPTSRSSEEWSRPLCSIRPRTTFSTGTAGSAWTYAQTDRTPTLGSRTRNRRKRSSCGPTVLFFKSPKSNHRRMTHVYQPERARNARR